MSNARPTKNDRRDAAREKARQMREEQKRRDRRNRVFVQGGIIVGALAVVALVAFLIFNNTRPAGPGPLNMASDGIQINQGNIATETGALPDGATPIPNPTAAADTIDIQMYVDYMCPFCGQFEATNGTYISGLLDNGGATVEIHPIAILDRNSLGTKYSTRAANAAACVANFSPNQFYDFHNLLFANQPQEGTAGLDDQTLIGLTTQANVQNADQISKCITDGTFKGWVGSSTDRALAGPIPNSNVAKVEGTPTVIVNGQKYTGSLTDAAQFSAFVIQAAGQAFNSTSTPTPTPTPTP